MNEIVVKGNYLDSTGAPVLATQMPRPSENHLGGIGIALGWTVRWVKAAGDVVDVFSNSGDELMWDHGRRRHVARLGDWIVWDGTGFHVLPTAAFSEQYAAVDFSVTATSPEGRDDNA